MDIIPAWMIEDLERLRKEQEAEKHVLRIELPVYNEMFNEQRPEREEESIIIIPLR